MSEPTRLPVRWADRAMFEAAPLAEESKLSDRPGDIVPSVTLLSMSPDPLGSVAAMSKMYKGEVVYNLADVTDEERLHYFNEIQKTHLKAPLESIDLHFLIEGVTRSFTHQMVRQRVGAVYAQESLRFAVKNDIDESVALPPSLRSLKEDDPRVLVWQRTVNQIDDGYHALVEAGIPAEDARGLLPHNIVTRLHYKTNLLALLNHGGNRLCTQAQFEWRLEFTSLINSIRNYRGPGYDAEKQWQYDKIAGIFRPICYLTGKCEFRADFDRACSIRERVDLNERNGRKSDEWHVAGYDAATGYEYPAIDPREWLEDAGAARVAQ